KYKNYLDRNCDQVTKMASLTSNVATMMHLLKGNIGTGILAIPHSFTYSGLTVGTVMLSIIGIVAIHCMHQLVNCQRVLCDRFKTVFLDYDEVAEKAFNVGPTFLRRFSTVAKRTVTVFLLITQFGFCCVYSLFVAVNIQTFIKNLANIDLDVHIWMLIELPFMILFCYIRQLNRLAVASTIANVLQVIGIIIVFSNLFSDLPPTWTRPQTAPISRFPLFFGTAIYAFEGIGIILPLKKEMKEPSAFGGLNGVLNTGMVLVTCLYVSFGFYGFLRFGPTDQPTITLDLPATPLNHSVQLLFAVAIFLSYALQLYVPITILWPYLVDKYNLDTADYKTTIYDYAFRTILVCITFMIAGAIPELDAFISLVGALSSSCLALVFPPIIEIATYWDNDWGKKKKYLFFTKNCLIILMGFLGFVTGTYASIEDIYHRLTQRKK
ncbi:proton-coupled amino acid transporter 1-like isoform X1, partial [Leptotrombidium deliense]